MAAPALASESKQRDPTAPRERAHHERTADNPLVVAAIGPGSENLRPRILRDGVTHVAFVSALSIRDGTEGADAALWMPTSDTGEESRFLVDIRLPRRTGTFMEHICNINTLDEAIAIIARRDREIAKHERKLAARRRARIRHL